MQRGGGLRAAALCRGASGPLARALQALPRGATGAGTLPAGGQPAGSVGSRRAPPRPATLRAPAPSQAHALLAEAEAARPAPKRRALSLELVYCAGRQSNSGSPVCQPHPLGRTRSRQRMDSTDGRRAGQGGAHPRQSGPHQTPNSSCPASEAPWWWQWASRPEGRRRAARGRRSSAG